uniref:Uncharacterized protein n=1 Tax=Aegilops tauschii subsp. strangulata TaxID=200361 RepID=A0A453J190_AEGTS
GLPHFGALQIDTTWRCIHHRKTGCVCKLEMSGGCGTAYSFAVTHPIIDHDLSQFR